MSYAPEVIADSSGEWAGNSLRFATRDEAEEWVADLRRRWILVRETRVVESDDPVKDALRAGELVSTEDALYYDEAVARGPDEPPEHEAA